MNLLVLSTSESVFPLYMGAFLIPRPMVMPYSPFFTSPGLVDRNPPVVPGDTGTRLDGVLDAVDGDGTVDACIQDVAVVGPIPGAVHDNLTGATRGYPCVLVDELEG